MTFEKNEWVTIHQVVLESSQRASNLPQDTKEVPLEMWVKGHALTSGAIGDEILIITKTGRSLKGRVVEIRPRYHHDFGDYLEEVDEIDRILLTCLEEGVSND